MPAAPIALVELLETASGTKALDTGAPRRSRTGLPTLRLL